MASQGGEAEDSGPAFVRPVKEQVFVSLHHHSTFSYLDGYGTPESHVEQAARQGMTAMALTEHGNVTSHAQLEQAGKKYGVKPIFGCELYCGEVGEGATRRKNHLTVLASTVSGYQNLLGLVSRGWSEGFYSEPTVSGDMFNGHTEGLIVLSGCSGSLLSTSIVGGKNVAEEDASYERGKRVAAKMLSAFGDGYYLEVQAFPELTKTKNINAALARMSSELGIPLVATLDAHYVKPNEGEMQMILHNLRPGKNQTIEEQARSWGYDVPLSFQTDKDLYNRLVHSGLTGKQAEQAIRNSREISERCNVEIPKVDNLRYPLPPGMDDPIVLFRTWIEEGWAYRKFDERLDDSEYAEYTERLKMEMDLIIEKGFVDYFLVESDQVRWAKDHGIPVGPARGSAAASLVCYLLRITEVNPMLFPNLLFERFIDRNRHDLPDIDLDFDDELRWMVRQYLVGKYGEERVGNIGTFTRYKGKNSLDDVGKVFRVPPAEVATVKELLIERSSGDLRANATIEDTIEMFPQVKEVFERYPDLYKAQLLEGNVKGMSVHAAGLVIANGPLNDFCATYTKTERVKDKATGGVVLQIKLDPDTGEAMQVVSLDKRDAEYLNVMKLDNLGLKTMAAIRHSLEAIGMTLDELYDLPFDDEDTINGFKENDCVGIFQFDGRAMRNVCEGVVPDNFMEVCDINALARPGPLHSGATGLYMDVKHGREPAVHYHDIIDEITRHTQFQVVYQEQILQTVRLLGGFDWEEAARIRKIISKKRGEQEFNRQRDKFVDGAAVHGMSPEDANKVFSMLATAGAYAFNAAHCVSYGMLAYWTMWLKRNHPAEFYMGMLRKFDSADKGNKRDQLLRDVVRKELPIHKLHLNKSTATWTVADGGIRPGFEQVNGIAEATSKALLAEREELGRFSSWKDVGAIKGIGPVTLEKMQDFISSDDPFGMLVMRDALDAVRSRLVAGELSDGPFALPVPTHTSSEVPYERTEGNVAVTWLGFVQERNLKDLFELHHSRTGEHLDPSTVYKPHLNEYVVMTCVDDDDVITVTVPRTIYRRFKERVWSLTPKKDLVLVRGHKKAVQARRAIYVSDMWVIDPETGEMK